MARLTDDQKQRFLALIEEGYDRGSAASQVNATGSQFKRAMNHTSRTFDSDLRDRYEAIVNNRPEGFQPKRIEATRAEPLTTTHLGYTKADHITDQEKETFLEKVGEGIPRDLAAREIGTSLLQIQRLARRDTEFRVALEAAYEDGYPRYQDWLRAKAIEHIREGNYQAWRDQAIIHLPEAAKLRTSKHEIEQNTSVQVFIEQVLPKLPPRVLQQVIEHVEKGGELKQLPRAS